MIELGGNIKLIGFKELDPGMLIVVKKIIGNYAKKISTISPFQELSLHTKEIHKTVTNQKYELQAKLVIDGNSVISAEVTDFNLFFAMDKALSKLMSDVSRTRANPIHDVSSSHEGKEESV